MQNNTESKYPDLPRPGECFRCREQGHLFKACTGNNIFKFFCYSCGRANTVASECPTCKKEPPGNVKRGQPN